MSLSATRSSISLRDARADDSKFLAQVWSGVIRRGAPEDQVAEMLSLVETTTADDDVRILVAEYDGQRAGAVYLQAGTVSPLNREPALLAVSPHVLPEFRRHGVGRALMDAAVAWAEDRGIGLVATAATAGARDANRFMARLALSPTAMFRIAPTALVRAKIGASSPAEARNRARVLSVRRTQGALRRRPSEG